MRSAEERQAELDRWLDELWRVTQEIVNVLYESRDGGVQLDPEVAFTIGMLHGVRAKSEKSSAD